MIEPRWQRLKMEKKAYETCKRGSWKILIQTGVAAVYAGLADEAIHWPEIRKFAHGRMGETGGKPE